MATAKKWGTRFIWVWFVITQIFCAISTVFWVPLFLGLLWVLWWTNLWTQTDHYKRRVERRTLDNE